MSIFEYSGDIMCSAPGPAEAGSELLTARAAYGRYLMVGVTCTEAYLAGQTTMGPESHPSALEAHQAWMEARQREGVPEDRFF